MADDVRHSALGRVRGDPDWLQRLSLVLARGQADIVLEAVKTARKNHRGRDGGRGASAEWSQTDCQPCVSLV